ncbi:MAG: methylated-DNA--[Oscillospiraceae bacterium]|nr:methylated-DNA--[protein]-cysteine S-methyltransferase [Oscillospiraceae bacterium]
MVKRRVFKSTIGNILVVEDGDAIVEISLFNGKSMINDSSALLDITERQLKEYFNGERKTFDIPLCRNGTEFQLKVWRRLSEIPYGTTKTYGEIAKEIGFPKAARAVGGACNKNPIIIVVPCHRVVGANGGMVGFACGIDVKEKLLELEKDIEDN